MPDDDQPKNVEDYALLIGIDNYIFFDRLKGAQEDIARFQKWLLASGGGSLPAKNIHPVLSPTDQDPDDPQPIQDKINQRLRKMGVMQGRRIGRRLYFYFSGHGYGRRDDVGMLMGNASRLELKNNVGLRNYRNFLLEWGFFDEIIFILDCCRDPIRYADTGVPPFTLPDQFLPKIPPKVNHITILACSYGEKAFMIPSTPGDPERRGILSKAILEGLVEQKATDSVGDITTMSLMDYLTKRVPELAGNHLQNQEPEYEAPLPMRNITLMTGIQKSQTIGIFLPKNITTLIIANNNLTQIVEYSVQNEVWNFTYLTEDPEKQKFVRRVSESKVPTNSGEEGVIIKVVLVQNCWYDLECSDGTKDILDLRNIHSDNIDYVFKFK